jgi:hypothetical protein
LSYDIISKDINALVRENHIPEGEEANRLAEVLVAYEAHLAHPLLFPVVLFYFFMSRLEPGIVQNVSSVEDLEKKVGELSPMESDSRPMAEREDVTALLTELHDTLKAAIKFLDAIRWAHRTAQLLLKTGADLEKVTREWEITQLRRDWAEIKQFLDDAVVLTINLEPEPVMTQQRCQSQIDIVSTN